MSFVSDLVSNVGNDIWNMTTAPFKAVNNIVSGGNVLASVRDSFTQNIGASVDLLHSAGGLNTSLGQEVINNPVLNNLSGGLVGDYAGDVSYYKDLGAGVQSNNIPTSERDAFLRSTAIAAAVVGGVFVAPVAAGALAPSSVGGAAAELGGVRALNKVGSTGTVGVNDVVAVGGAVAGADSSGTVGAVTQTVSVGNAVNTALTPKSAPTPLAPYPVIGPQAVPPGQPPTTANTNLPKAAVALYALKWLAS